MSILKKLAILTVSIGALASFSLFEFDPNITINVNSDGKTVADEKEETSVTYESVIQSVNASNYYILADSDSRNLSESDIANLSEKEAQLARNEIFARHGRRFKTKEIQDYFDHQSWYTGKYDPDDFDKKYTDVLNNYEKHNVELIKSYEKENGWIN